MHIARYVGYTHAGPRIHRPLRIAGHIRPSGNAIERSSLRDRAHRRSSRWQSILLRRRRGVHLWRRRLQAGLHVAGGGHVGFIAHAVAHGRRGGELIRRVPVAATGR